MCQGAWAKEQIVAQAAETDTSSYHGLKSFPALQELTAVLAPTHFYVLPSPSVAMLRSERSTPVEHQDQGGT